MCSSLMLWSTGLRQPGLDQAEHLPAGRRGARVGQVDEQAAFGVGRQAVAVRVGDQVVLHRAGLRHEDLNVEQVVVAGPVAPSGDCPDTRRRCGTAARWRSVCCRARTGRRRRRPPARSAPTAPALGVPACQLSPSVRLAAPASMSSSTPGICSPVRVEQPAGRVERGHRDLAGQQACRSGSGVGRKPECGQPGLRRELRSDRGRQASRIHGQREGGAAGDAVRGDGQAAVRRRVEPVAGRRAGIRIPADVVAGQPVRLESLQAGQSVAGQHGQHVGGRDVAEGDRARRSAGTEKSMLAPPGTPPAP